MSMATLYPARLLFRSAVNVSSLRYQSTSHSTIVYVSRQAPLHSGRALGPLFPAEIRPFRQLGHLLPCFRRTNGAMADLREGRCGDRGACFRGLRRKLLSVVILVDHGFMLPRSNARIKAAQAIESIDPEIRQSSLTSISSAGLTMPTRTCRRVPISAYLNTHSSSGKRLPSSPWHPRCSRGRTMPPPEYHDCRGKKQPRLSQFVPSPGSGLPRSQES